ncbi:MAG: lysylphosphatidylglycerol synthase domain-containing protein [Deltaproteobacteria bacterium]
MIAQIREAFATLPAATCVPITPGGLGVQEAAITLAFATAGIPVPQALACALAYRCAHLVPLALVGAPALVTSWPRKAAA